MASNTPRIDLINGAENVIINGGMDFFQRSVGPLAMPATEYVSGYFVADRFSGRNEIVSAAANTLRSSDVPTVAEAGVNFNFSLEVDITTAKAVLAANDSARIKHIVEGYDAARFSRKGFRLQFWVKSNKTGLYTLIIGNAGSNRVFLTTYTIDSASTWEQKWVDVPAELTGVWNTTNGEGLVVSWNLGAGSGSVVTGFDDWKAGGAGIHASQTNLFDNTVNFLRLTGIMLCPGNFSSIDEPLPFFRSSKTIQQELAMCQRYLIRFGSGGNGYPTGLYGQGSSTTDIRFYVWQARDMRTSAPTFVSSGGNIEIHKYTAAIPAGAPTSISTTLSGYQFNILGMTGIVDGEQYYLSTTSGAVLTLDAEL